MRPRENCFTKSDRALKSAGMDPDRHILLHWAYAQRCQRRKSRRRLNHLAQIPVAPQLPWAQWLSPLMPSLLAVVPLAHP